MDVLAKCPSLLKHGGKLRELFVWHWWKKTQWTCLLEVPYSFVRTLAHSFNVFPWNGKSNLLKWKMVWCKLTRQCKNETKPAKGWREDSSDYCQEWHTRLFFFLWMGLWNTLVSSFIQALWKHLERRKRHRSDELNVPSVKLNSKTVSIKQCLHQLCCGCHVLSGLLCVSLTTFTILF